MKISFRLNAREKNIIFLTRLDPLLCFKLESEILPINDLMGGLILFTDWSLNFPYFRKEFSRYFSVKKNVPIAMEKEEFNSNISDFESSFSNNIENVKIKFSDEYLSQIYYLFDIDFGTTVSIDNNIVKILNEIVEGKKLGLREANISNGEVLKSITYLLTNNLNFQSNFREYMFLGHLYGLSYIDMGQFLDGHYEAIETRKFLPFKDHFNKDFDKWKVLLSEKEIKYMIKETKKSEFNEPTLSHSRTFYLRAGFWGFVLLDYIIIASSKYDFPFLWMITDVWEHDVEENKSLINYSVSAMRNKLTFIKGQLDKI